MPKINIPVATKDYYWYLYSDAAAAVSALVCVGMFIGSPISMAGCRGGRPTLTWLQLGPTRQDAGEVEHSINKRRIAYSIRYCAPSRLPSAGSGPAAAGCGGMAAASPGCRRLILPTGRSGAPLAGPATCSARPRRCFQHAFLGAPRQRRPLLLVVAAVSGGGPPPDDGLGGDRDERDEDDALRSIDVGESWADTPPPPPPRRPQRRRRRDTRVVTLIRCGPWVCCAPPRGGVGCGCCGKRGHGGGVHRGVISAPRASWCIEAAAP